MVEVIKQEIQHRNLMDRPEDSAEKIRRHRKNLLSLLSLKRSILEYEKSPSEQQLLRGVTKEKARTVEVKPAEVKTSEGKAAEARERRAKQSKTIHTDTANCTSDRILDRRQPLPTKGGRSNTKLSLRQEQPQMDLRKEITSKINGLKSAQTIGALSQNSKQLLTREAASGRVGQFLEKYKSSYRMEARKLTAADRQHQEIERMASEACKLKDTADSTDAPEGDQHPQQEAPKGRSAADIRLTVKARLQMRRDLAAKTMLKERYQVLQKIGRGLSGEVYKARDVLSDRLVAIKVIADPAREEEYEFYKNMQHRNIVSYYNNFKADGNRYLVLEYFPYTLARLCRTRPLDAAEARRVFRGVANGVMFLHGLSIAHRDIKAENIVVSEDLSEVKFIDFGLCIDLSRCEGQLTREFCGTVHYMPPEILQKRAYNPKRADIWSLGVLLYRLLFNRYPFQAKNEFQMQERIRKTRLVFGDAAPELALLLQGMLTRDPAQRFTILDVLDSKWLS